MARVYVTWQGNTLTDLAKDTEGSAQNTDFNSRKQLHSGKQLDMSLNLSMCAFLFQEQNTGLLITSFLLKALFLSLKIMLLKTWRK